MIRIRLTIFIVFSLIFTISVYSQTKIDSLKMDLIQAKQDTNKVNILVKLSQLNSFSNPKNAIYYGLEAKNLAYSLGFYRGEALALKYIGMAYYYQSEFLETIQYWQECHDVFEAIDDRKGVANMLSNIGAIYFNQGEDTKAIEFYLKTLKVAEQIKDSLRIATVLNNIGGVYFNKDATQDKALSYYLRAYDISKLIGDQNAIGTSSVNTGVYYFVKNNTDSALYYLNKSLVALTQISNGNISYAMKFIGETYVLKDDFETAEKYLKEALRIARNNNNGMNITMVLIALGNTYKKKGVYSKAIDYYKQAENLADEIRLNYQLEEAYGQLALSYSAISNYKNAYKYQTLFSHLKDTLYNAGNDKKIQRLQFNYDLEKKQGEVDILKKDKELQELEVRRQKAVKNAFFIGLILIFIIAFILFRGIRIKIKTNRILDKQNMEIENLVLNILPADVAKELRENGVSAPRYYENASVLFTDFKGFSTIAEGLSPNELVSELNDFFVAFDQIMEKHNLEKIKTIGDAYMCAGGIPKNNKTHPVDTVKAGLEMQEFMHANNVKRKKEGKIPWQLRVGIHTGPIVAGVVGRKKYAYDIWGSTVNISSRMESNGEAGKLNISSATYELIKDKYICTHRGKIYAKNIGDIDMYFVDAEVPPSHKTPKSIPSSMMN